MGSAVNAALQGRLWAAVAEASRRALASGALQPIEAEIYRLQDGGLPFTARVAVNLRRKHAQDRQQGTDFNPFLAPEPELTLGAVGPSHLAVLNKFNVLERHLLLVSRDYRPQDAALDPADHAVLARVLEAGPALAFYNGGRSAGASQGHRHLQLLPADLGQGGLPFQPLFDAAVNGTRRLPGLPLRHWFTRLPRQPDAHVLAAAYEAGLAACGIACPGRAGERWPDTPYNLLLTAEWMLLVPRRAEQAAGISLNSLAFVGSLFVPDRQRLQTLRAAGPRQLLQQVGWPP